MDSVEQIYDSIVAELVKAGAVSPYKADANEPDPRYKAYGVRREGRAAFIVYQVVVQPQPARCVIERQQLEAAHAEHRARPVGLQHPHKGLAPGHFVGGHDLSYFWRRPASDRTSWECRGD